MPPRNSSTYILPDLSINAGNLLLESGFNLLLEDGSYLLLEFNNFVNNPNLSGRNSSSYSLPTRN